MGNQLGLHHTAQRGHGAAVCSFFRHAMAFGRVMRIYAEGHTRVEQSLIELKAIADEMLGGRADDMDIVVHSSGLRVDGRPVHHEPAVTETFTEVMRARGIRAIVLRSGIRESELALLADLLGRPVRDIVSDGGVDALLAGRDHPHFNLLTAVTAFGAGPEEEECSVTATAPDDATTRQVDELLGEAVDLPPDPSEQHRLVYTACDKDELGTRSSNLLAVAEETLRAEAARHDAERTAAMALCDMVGRAADESEYRHRRDLLCTVVHEKRLDPRSMRIAQLHLAGDLPHWPHEAPEALLLVLGALAGDIQLLESALGRSVLDSAAARRVAEELAGREEAFDVFNTLLRASLPENILAPVEEVLVHTIRRRTVPFRQWAVGNPQRFLSKACFQLLMRKADFILGPIVKEYFQSAAAKDRDRVVDLLVEDGTDKALRMFVTAARHAGNISEPRTLLALGKFKHPLAVEVLRDVVLRCNTEKFDAEEASSAIRALAATGIDDALDFLEEVARRRKFFIPIYRRALRDMALDALEAA